MNWSYSFFAQVIPQLAASNLILQVGGKLSVFLYSVTVYKGIEMDRTSYKKWYKYNMQSHLSGCSSTNLIRESTLIRINACSAEKAGTC
jgi:hypothetical protein